MEKKTLMVVNVAAPLSRETHQRLSEMLEPIAAATGMQVLVADELMEVEIHRDLTPVLKAIEANTAAVLELCGLVAASFEQGQEEAYDEPGAAQTMNSPRRKR